MTTLFLHHNLVDIPIHENAPEVQYDKDKEAIWQHVRFAITAPVGSEVYLAGTFNEWDSTQLRLQDHRAVGEFEISLPLCPGRYEYKFLANGVWTADELCPLWVVNGIGTLNSLVIVS